MVNTPDQDDAPEPTDDETLRQRLLGRIAVAAVVIVGLLGSLAVFDALNTPSPVPGPVASAPPVKPPAPTTGTVPSTAASDTPSDTASAKPEEKDDEKAAVTAADKPAEGTQSTPLPPLPSERLTPPATAQKAIAHPGGAVPAPGAAKPSDAKPATGAAQPPAVAAAPGKPTTAVSEGSAAPKTPLQREVAQAARGASVTPTPATPTTRAWTPGAAAVEASRGYALQLGVFTNFANAEELRQKLETAGIPATVEARVRAGPFASRAEVEAARGKLRALGISESILIAVKQ